MVAEFRKSLDFLVIDLRLPHINAIELIRKFADEGLRIPSVVVSGQADRETVGKISQFDNIWFLSKPCDLN